MSIHADLSLQVFLRPAGRRSLVRTIGTLAAALGLAVTMAAGPAKNPEFCAPGGVPTPEQAARMAAALLNEPASTQRMAALLQKIARESNPGRNPFRSTEKAALTREMLARTTDPQKIFELKVELTQQLLNAGRPEEALEENMDTERRMKELNVPEDDLGILRDLLTARAICYLRMGEQENCLLGHNNDSCIFPIQGGGVHKLQRGSRGAVAVLTELLDRLPGDLRARWLINIAYMTLGEYPGAVPSKWLLDPKLFASEYDIKRFPDVAGAMGLDLDDLAGGVVMEDFDNDGLLDLMVSSWGLTDQMHLFHNNGDGTFTDVTERAGLIGETGGLNMIQCDYNNDGFMDVLVLRGAWLRTEGHYPLSLLRNNGDGTFTDVTEESGLLSHLKPTQTAVWFDYNGDGWLDLFVANESVGRDVNPC